MSGKVAPDVWCFRAADWEWSGLNRGIIPQRLSFHPERRWRALVDNDISLWQTQAKRQIHVGRDGEKKERKKRTGQEVREPGESRAVLSVCCAQKSVCAHRFLFLLHLWSPPRCCPPSSFVSPKRYHPNPPLCLNSGVKLGLDRVFRFGSDWKVCKLKKKKKKMCVASTVGSASVCSWGGYIRAHSQDRVCLHADRWPL